MSTVYVLCDDRQACACACLNRGQSLPSLCPGSRAGELDAPALRNARISPLCVPPFASGDPAGAADPIPQHYPEHPPSQGKAGVGGRKPAGSCSYVEGLRSVSGRSLSSEELCKRPHLGKRRGKNCWYLL